MHSKDDVHILYARPALFQIRKLWQLHDTGLLCDKPVQLYLSTDASRQVKYNNPLSKSLCQVSIPES